MDADRIKAEIFDNHYRDIKKHLTSGNYTAARLSTIQAAKCMYEMAKDSTGPLRAERLRQANELYRQIEKIDRLIEAKKKGQTSQARQGSDKKPSPEQQVMRGGNSTSRGGDEDERIFEAMAVPDVSFDDIVGLHDVKKAVRDKIIEPRRHPELYEKYKVKSGGGILMYGPPGTGKTMIAKAIARESGAEFFAISCSDLVSKWFGSTERNIDNLFETARSRENAVIFFDEFDSLAANRDKNNSTVMRRVVPELLTQLQGVSEDNKKKGGSLLVLAATNVPWMLDSAFLRPGRFDECIYVGLPDDDARRGILKKNLSGIPTKGSIDYELLIDRTNGFNCADIVQLVTKAKTFAMDRERRGLSDEGITMEDFDRAFETTHSSVMREDIEKMIKWRKNNGLVE